MSIFTLHSNVVEDYRDFVRSFFTVADDRAREFIDHELLDEARLWPEALLQVSPSYARVASVDELADHLRSSRHGVAGESWLALSGHARISCGHGKR